MTIRAATAADASAVAELHAASWRVAYRGMYSDAFLDGPVFDDRRRVWQTRLAAPPDGQCVLLDDDGTRLRGFICTYAAHDPEWGALIDNLHVTPDLRGNRLGDALMAAGARWLLTAAPDAPVYLWALEGNAPARRFYERLGGRLAETVVTEHTDGGRGPSCRYVWPSPASILAATG